MKTITLEMKTQIDDHLREVLLSIKGINYNNVIIAGGCIASMLRNEKIEDYDIFFTTKNEVYDMWSKLNKIFPNTLNYPAYNILNGIDFVNKGNIVEKDNIKISVYTVTITKNNNKIQFITRTSGSLEHIFSEFDFIHSKYYYTLKDGLKLEGLSKLECDVDNLRVNDGGKICFDTLRRIIKFTNRGWKINDDELYKLYQGFKNINISQDGDDLYYGDTVNDENNNLNIF